MNHLLFPMPNGVMALSKSKRVTVGVSTKGQISVINKKIKINFKLLKNRLIKGIIFFVYGVFFSINSIFGTKFTFEEISAIKKTKNSLNVSEHSIYWFIIILLSFFIIAGLLGYLPIYLSYYIAPKNYNLFVKRLIVLILKLVIISAILLLLKLLDSFKQYYRFNETLKTVQLQNKQINFLSFFMFASFVSVVVTTMFGISSNNWYSLPFNFFLLCLSIVISYEFYSNFYFKRGFKWLFAPIDFLIYSKPCSIEQKCVNILKDQINIGAQYMTDDTISFKEAYSNCKQILTDANVYEQSDLDFIFCEILKLSRAQVKLLKQITVDEYNRILKIVKRRAKKEPISKIFGYAEFYGLKFKVNKNVLSPRMDTERLVECALKNTDKNSKILEIGTGSGIIAICLAKFNNANVTAVDISSKAIEVAKQNAKTHNAKIEFICKDFFECSFDQKFDVIISNPPYIPTKDVESLDEEVKNFDPILALDGGEKGLDFYEGIIKNAPRLLSPNGQIFFEIGINQAKDVKKLLQKSFKNITIDKDYNNIERVVHATLK